MIKTKCESLSILLDLNSLGWVSLRQRQQNLESSKKFDIDNLIEIITFIINTHKLQNNQNFQSLFIFDEKISNLIFPITKEHQNMLSSFSFSDIKKSIYSSILKYLQYKTPLKTKHSKFVSVFYRSICLINKQKKIHQKKTITSKILILLNSNIKEEHCFNMMNCVQAAKSLHITIDAFVLSKSKKQNYLTQACSKTKGLYLPMSFIDDSIIEYFLTAYLIGNESRKYFKLPYLTIASFEAACYCHKKIIQTGWVCSSCLAIYCESQGKRGSCFCQFCGVRFDVFDSEELSL